MLKTLRQLRRREAVHIPVYDYSTHSRRKETVAMPPADVILFEGILVLNWPDIRRQLDLKLFVDVDSDTRLSRRGASVSRARRLSLVRNPMAIMPGSPRPSLSVLRDIGERGRDLDGVLDQYLGFVKPAFDEFIEPSKKHADVIIPRGSENLVAIGAAWPGHAPAAAPPHSFSCWAEQI